jgi:hypothetical protein
MVCGMVAGARSGMLRVAVLAGIMTVGLAGCVADEPEPPAPSPSESAPAEPTDEELLAEAREVYEGYLAASEAMSAAEQVDYTTLTPWTTIEYATAETGSETELRREGIRVDGSATVNELVLDASDAIAAVACLDVSQTRFSDSAGMDVTPADRDLIVPLELTFVRQGDSLLLSAQIPHDGSVLPCA